MGTYYYLAIEPNIYELPIAVAESPRELGELLGISPKAIVEKMSRARARKEWCEFVRIPVNGECVLPEWKLPVERVDGRRKSITVKAEGFEKTFSSVTEAAKFLGLNKNSAINWARKGYGGGYRWEKA